jgi:hypothetical protein
LKIAVSDVLRVAAMVNKRGKAVVKTDYFASGDTMAVVAARHGHGVRTLQRWSAADTDGSWEDQRRRLSFKVSADVALAVARETEARTQDDMQEAIANQAGAFEFAAKGLSAMVAGMAEAQVADLKVIWAEITGQIVELKLATHKEVATKVGPMRIELNPMDRITGLRGAMTALKDCQGAMRKALGLDKDGDDGDNEGLMRPALIPEKSDDWRGLVNDAK